jgi:hypothetical protein
MSGLAEWVKSLLSVQDKKKVVSDSPTGSVTVQKTGPRRLSLTVTGIISAQQIAAAQRKLLELAGPGGQSRGLIQAEEFTGFARGAAGGMAAIERMHEVDELVDRIAVVADRAKHEDMNLFLCGWARKAQLKFFAPGELEKAEAWLES